MNSPYTVQLIKIKALKRRSQKTYDRQSGYYTNRYCEPQEFDFWEKGPFDYALLIDGAYFYCEPVNVLLKRKEVVFFCTSIRQRLCRRRNEKRLKI